MRNLHDRCRGVNEKRRLNQLGDEANRMMLKEGACECASPTDPFMRHETGTGSVSASWKWGFSDGHN
jgi:hypothetical protein